MYIGQCRLCNLLQHEDKAWLYLQNQVYGCNELTLKQQVGLAGGQALMHSKFGHKKTRQLQSFHTNLLHVNVKAVSWKSACKAFQTFAKLMPEKSELFMLQCGPGSEYLVPILRNLRSNIFWARVDYLAQLVLQSNGLNRNKRKWRRKGWNNNRNTHIAPCNIVRSSGSYTAQKYKQTSILNSRWPVVRLTPVRRVSDFNFWKTLIQTACPPRHLLGNIQ